jgi:HAE1 family hydrophobic/amphiphilic exporter-1
MFFLGVALLGMFALQRLSVDLLPDISIPKLTIQTTYSNATPEEVEHFITEPIESAVSAVVGVKRLTSISREGISVVTMEFFWDTEMDYAMLSVREKLDALRFALPQDAGRPTIIRIDPSSKPMMMLVVTGQTAEGRGQTVEVRSQKQEARSQTANGKRQTADGRRQNLKLETSNLKPETSNLKPKTPNPKPQTRNAKPGLSR